MGGFSSFHQSVTAPSPSNGAADMPEMLKSLRCRGQSMNKLTLINLNSTILIIFWVRLDFSCNGAS